MKNVIEIINELKARRTEIANGQDFGERCELADINITLETLKPYYNDTSFEIKCTGIDNYETKGIILSGFLSDLGNAFEKECRYLYEFSVKDGSAKFWLNSAQLDIVINALQNAKAEISDE